MLDADGPGPGGLRLEEVGRRYGVRGRWVLRDVTLEVPRGSLVRVEGANGSGKSTLLRMVAGVDRPTAGRLLGRPAAGTAYVPERFPAALPFPVLRYLTHLGAIRGLPPAAARARALHWLDRFGVTGHARTPLDELSKGTSQKVAVAQALLAEPDLLVLDEAWTGLDTTARAVLDDAVRERLGAGATVFYVDHDPRRLAGEATAVYAVDEGGTVRPAATPHRPANPGRGPAAPGAGAEASGRASHAPPLGLGPDEGAGSVGGALPDSGAARSGGPRPGAGAAPHPADGPGGTETVGLAGSVVPASATAVPDGGGTASAAPARGHVVIEAAGSGEVPAAVGAFVSRRSDGGRVTVEVPAGESDGVLRALLGAEPPWHIEAVRGGAPRSRGQTRADADPAATALHRGPGVLVRVPRGRTHAAAVPSAGEPGAAGSRRRLAALVSYQADLLARSHRWLPPLLLYGAVMAIGVAGGQPLLGSLGYASALLLPVAAWLVRVCVTGEPGAARACTASAVGAGRAHLGALLAALGASALLGLVGTGAVALVSGAHTDDSRIGIPVGPALLAGLMAAAVSVLLGTAVGALTNPPLLPGTGWSVLVTAFGAGAVLLTTGSPAQAAVTSLVHGSQTGAVRYPLVALVVAVCVTALALWASVRAVARLGAARP